MSNKCILKPGPIIEPCKMLSEMTEHSNGIRNGINVWVYSKIPTGQVSRILYGIRDKAHKNGMLFNYCPWCGTEIGADQ